MVSKVVMPRLSLTMKEGTVVQWFKKEGEAVQKGEPLVEVLSEKVTYDIEAPESGTLRRILANEGSNMPVNQAIGIIAAPDEQITDVETEIPKPSVETEKSVPTRENTTEITQRILASPAARRLSKELGVDLTQVVGTGPEGRIVEDDVKRDAERASSKLEVKEVIPLIGIRKTTAERLALSARTAPHSTITMEVDMSETVKLHEETRVSYTGLLVKAVAMALREHLYINSALDEDRIKVFHDINVGFAVATEKGLVVPVVHNADKKTLSELHQIVEDLTEKAKQGKLTKQDLTGGTFTITNLGMYGVDLFIPIINPPESAILGIGRITEKPIVVEKEVKTKHIIQLSLAFDHRVIDGAPAAEFLRRIKQLLESEVSQSQP